MKKICDGINLYEFVKHSLEKLQVQAMHGRTSDAIHTWFSTRTHWDISEKNPCGISKEISQGNFE